MVELSIVVPVFNEPDNIGPTLRQLQAAVHTPAEVLVVYDFDEDTTLPVVRAMQAELPNVRLLRNDLGRGVLNAMKAGIAAAQGEFVLITMADGSDEVELVDRMVEIAHGGADVVAASRYMRGGRQEGGPLLKRTLSRLAGLSLHWIGRLPIHDATNNFKLYRRSFLESVKIESRGGFELAIELSVKADLAGRRLAELPTAWRDRTAGQSRFRLRAWLPLYLRWYLHLFASQLRRFTISRRVAGLFGLLTLAGAVWWHLPSLGQALLEHHSFRQTQTAWTALIFNQQGIDLLHPRVPVFGPPWDLPFEFPLFQAGASLVMDAGFAPDVALRVTGLATFVLTAIVLWRLVARLAGEGAGVVGLLAFMVSGLALLWSRTSMIEYLVTATAAGTLYAALRWHDGRHWGWYALAVIAGVVAMLVKPTTAVMYLPALLALGWTGLRARDERPIGGSFGYAGAMVLLIGVPLAFGYAWTAYADAIKAASPYTADQTSAALTTWNFGTIAQRLDLGTWESIAGRVEELVLGGATIFWVALGFIGCLSLKRRAFAGAFLAGGFVGPLVFVNLYWIHDYYLIALTPMAAAGVAFGLLWLWRQRRWVAPPLLGAVLIVAWVLTLQRAEHYWGIQFWPTVTGGERHLEAVAYIDARSNPDDLVVVTGRGWNPATLYYARRWGLMVTGGVDESLARAMRPEMLVQLRSIGYARLFHCPTNEECSATYDLTVDPPRRIP
jgi:glycosyltransferase involved in cell wall biosynthesis